MAGYHAAQALIFEAIGRVFKTHSAVQDEFGRLVKDESGVGTEVRTFLGRAYTLKAIADYETGPGSKISAARAREAVQTARRVVECVVVLLTSYGRSPREPDVSES